MTHRESFALVAVCILLAVPAAYAQQTLELVSPNAQTAGWFGHAVADAGDVDGDGCSDIVIGAPQEGGDDPGCAYLFSGTTGQLLRTLWSPNPSPPLPDDVWGDHFGMSVRGVGDINASGYNDVVVGSPGENVFLDPPYSFWLFNVGRAYIFEGSTGAAILTTTFFGPNPDFTGQFGGAVDPIGDVNGDGVTDMVAGAEEWMEGFGMAFIMDGATGDDLHMLGAANPANAHFGCAVAGIPDVTNDGVNDALVGAYRESPTGYPGFSGDAYIFDGATGAQVRILTSPNAEAGGCFGVSVASVADLNGDGIPEVAIGAQFELDDGCGCAYVFDPTSGSVIHELMSPTPGVAGGFGASVAHAPDVDGDGVPDVAVGAPNEAPDGGFEGAGRVHLFSGADGTWLCTVASPYPAADGIFGSSVATLQGAAASGPRLLVGAPQEDPGYSDAGRAYAIPLARDLAALAAGSILTLSWMPWPGATAHWVYGAANAPWFTPGLADPFEFRLAVLPGNAGSWATSTGVGDPADNVTFTVVPVDEDGRVMARTRRAGEFDFDVSYLSDR